MSEQSSTIISKVWGMCNPLRDDGVSYGDYLEQLTYLIFLKMSDEYARPPYNKQTGIPAGYTWADMNTLKGAELEEKYKAILEELGKQSGLLGKIFKQAANKISNAAILYRIVQMIDKEKWVSMSSDVKGEIYEGLLQKNAEDIKSGAGQYFTPRPLIRAMVRCVSPEPGKTIADPCCGSGGFFLAAQEYMTQPGLYTLDRDAKEFLKNSTFYGNELVATTFKMALMNLYLHNIGDIYGTVPVTQGDALLMDPGYRVDYVLTNPPFGKKSSITMTNEEGEEEEEDLVYNRQDFWTTSSNKQLNFIQHINTILNATGKAAVVVPDNVLFEGGAGETIRKKLLETTDLHTILRLPTGIFYKPVSYTHLDVYKRQVKGFPWMTAIGSSKKALKALLKSTISLKIVSAKCWHSSPLPATEAAIAHRWLPARNLRQTACCPSAGAESTEKSRCTRAGQTAATTRAQSHIANTTPRRSPPPWGLTRFHTVCRNGKVGFAPPASCLPTSTTPICPSAIWCKEAVSMRLPPIMKNWANRSKRLSAICWSLTR